MATSSNTYSQDPLTAPTGGYAGGILAKLPKDANGNPITGIEGPNGPVGGSGGGTPPVSGPASTPGSGTASGSPYPPPPSYSQPTSTQSWAQANPQLQGRNDDLYSTLMGRANQGLNISRNDPVIRAQADAYAANEERTRRNYISDTAERSGPLANLQGEKRMASERAGQRTGAFEAELMGRELSARRDEIAQALQGMQGMLSGDQQLALQRELGLLNNALGQRGMDVDLYKTNVNNNQFWGDLGLRAENQHNYWNDPLRTTATQGR